MTTTGLPPAEYRESPIYSGYMIGRDGTVIGRAGRPLSPNQDAAGYRMLNLCLAGNRRKTIRLHRVVCETFHGERPSPSHVVAHIDGDNGNNAASNLRWATPEENEADKRAHGRVAEGERHGMSRLTADAVREIRMRRARGETQLSVAASFGVSVSAVKDVLRGRTWGSVS